MRTSNWFKALLIPFIVIPAVVVGCYIPDWLSQDRPECPHDWHFGKIRVLDLDSQQVVPLQTANPSGLSVSGMQTNVPEFNDCQRLIIGTGSSAHYDSLYAVFARDSVDIDTVHIRNMFDDRVAVPMVEIMSMGGTYEQLSLRPGFNCLFVGKERDRWFARLVRFGPKERDCHTPLPVSHLLGSPQLTIRRTSYPGLGWKDYPGVARWDWDVDNNTQVIGFKCLDGWCEVGQWDHPINTGPDLSATMGGAAGLSGSPVLKVRGWYDQQRLSPTAAHWWSSGQGPTPVIGTIIPVPGLDRFDTGFFRAPNWRVIALVNLSQPSADYEAQQGFVPMTPDRITTISLCVEQWTSGTTSLSGSGCPEITDALRKGAKCAAEPGAPTQHWWAQTIPADNPHPRYRCIVRRSVNGVPVPGTARWRWLASDETTWGRCGGGCCSGH